MMSFFLFPDVFVQFLFPDVFCFQFFCLAGFVWSVFCPSFCCFFPGVSLFFSDCFFSFLCGIFLIYIYTLQTNCSHLNMDGRVTRFLLGRPMFRGYISFGDGIPSRKLMHTTFGKRKIIDPKVPAGRGYVGSLEGISCEIEFFVHVFYSRNLGSASFFQKTKELFWSTRLSVNFACRRLLRTSQQQPATARSCVKIAKKSVSTMLSDQEQRFFLDSHIAIGAKTYSTG